MLRANIFLIHQHKCSISFRKIEKWTYRLNYCIISTWYKTKLFMQQYFNRELHSDHIFCHNTTEIYFPNKNIHSTRRVWALYNIQNIRWCHLFVVQWPNQVHTARNINNKIYVNVTYIATNWILPISMCGAASEITVLPYIMLPRMSEIQYKSIGQFKKQYVQICK